MEYGAYKPQVSVPLHMGHMFIYVVCLVLKCTMIYQPLYCCFFHIRIFEIEFIIQLYYMSNDIAVILVPVDGSSDTCWQVVGRYKFWPKPPWVSWKSIQGFRYYVQMCLLCICLYVNLLYAINIILNRKKSSWWRCHGGWPAARLFVSILNGN